ncbi:MAG: FAD-binding oxidoreductase [Candidatus Marinimicrobia bacterium]|nr:FAD-binding oxidoreductase [Candidatus Neomarinimicrobiota bacterium]
MEAEIYDRIADIVGPKWVSDDPEILIGYARDLTTYGRFGKERRPECVVLPATTHEVRNIIYLARLKKVPVTVYGTGINVGSGTLSKAGGIILDLRRMNKILEIDEEHHTATVQAGVSIARLSTEVQKRGMFIVAPGAPALASVVSNYTQGNVNKASGRIGWQYHSIISCEMVLPDGSVIRTGSASDTFIGKKFWPHGPGPDLWILPRYTLGTLGVVTELTVKCFPLDDEMKLFWMSFEDLEKAVKAYKEILHREICTGSSLYVGNKYHYFGDTVESGERLCKIHPNVQLILTLQGTKRRVEYEEKTVRMIADKYGGRNITDVLPFYQMYVDSHITMAASLYSEYTMRYFGSPGAGVVLFPTASIDKIVPAYKTFVKILLDDPYFRDPEGGSSELYTGLITYPNGLGGHNCLLEPCTGGWASDPVFGAALHRVLPKITKAWADIGLAPDQKDGNPRPHELGLMNTYIDLIKKIKKRFDPDDYMHPGQIIPLLYK